ncbi:MAG: hypothetical protein PHQ58_04920 [Rhodoferax sp.]|uniref:hypothetical protein n=1 Tax=Rhodoferax sp. TaxID=50421 RepID=UPI0026057D1E|nr:hypothetical protein [Rhodoferax sp.]MDD2879756.1 hypothetical protein [Rhodoferax sp.]
MSQVLPNRYPLDLTGVSRDNYVSSEKITLRNTELRSAVPTYGPFFKAGLQIKDETNDKALTKEQYKLMNLVPLPTAMAGNGDEVYSIIIITDLAVSNTINVSYQSLGGDYTRSYATIAKLIEAVLVDTRKRDSSWPNILNKDVDFEPALHFHAMGDVVGWEYVAAALEEVKTAILLGDEVRLLNAFNYIDTHRQAVLNKIDEDATALDAHTVDTSNPHHTTKEQVGLGNVENYPLATPAIALAGISTSHYLTPATAMDAISATIAVDIAAHEDNVNNPHMTTKAQLGLGNVQNYAIATNTQALAGTSTTLYVSPANVKAVVDNATPSLVPQSLIGQANGVVPLNTAKQIDETYLEKLIVSGAPAVYDLQKYTLGKPASRQVLLQITALRQFTCGLGFSGSIARCGTAATQNASCDIQRNGTTIGTLTFPAGNNFGSFNVLSATTFVVGDTLTIKAPNTVDTALADLTIGVFGTLKTA